MRRINQHLTSISAQSPRSGPPPGRRLLAAILCALLVLGSIAPGFAVAGEADSEGEGTTPPIEVPVGPPDLDPGGEEAELEEVPASGGEEEGALEAEGVVEVEAPAPEEVTSAAPEVPAEIAAPPAPVPAPEGETLAPQPEQVQQKAEPEVSEPVANQSIVAPKQKPDERPAPSSPQRSSGEPAAPSSEPIEEEAATEAPQPKPAVRPPADHGRHIGGSIYIVKPGDCLWHIAARLLPADADVGAIETKVAWLYERNESAIGTGDPNLIYPGTKLFVR